MSDTMNISPELLEKMNRYWEAANYLSAGQLYLLDNPLLREPLTMDHVKKKIVGHWGTVPGQNFIYVHYRLLNCLFLMLRKISLCLADLIASWRK